jgi:copper(I)-binding protein
MAIIARDIPSMKPPIAAAAVLVFAASAQAASHPKAVLDAVQPWSRPAMAGGTGVGYMTLRNLGKADDALVAASSPLARKVEIHQSMASGSMASMRPVARLAIRAGGTVTLGPGGYHLMFIGLARPLKPGDALPATLTFASGAHLAVRFQVGAGAAPAAVEQPAHDMSEM